MRNSGTVFLMYHELGLPNRALTQPAPRYKRYVIPAPEFDGQMAIIQRSNMCGVNVSEALRFSESAVAITFDDGCETDLLVAAPVLSRLGFGATFYVIAGFIGKPGYMSAVQLRELATIGFEIGCHSMTHISMAGLSDAVLRREVLDSRSCLEQLLGKSIEHFSCPGGEYDARTIAFVRESGYRSMSMSLPRTSSATADIFRLGRVPVKRGLGPAKFEKLCRGKGLGKLAAQFRLQEGARRVLGNKSYYRLREAILESTNSRQLP